MFSREVNICFARSTLQKYTVDGHEDSACSLVTKVILLQHSIIRIYALAAHFLVELCRLEIER
jgi:hypothetical protein